MAQCRRHALAVREAYGVWGGLSESERDALVGRDDRVLRVAPSGSPAQPAQTAQSPGPARINRAGSGNAGRASLQAGVIELAAPDCGAELQLITGPRDTPETVDRWYPFAPALAGTRAAAVPSSLTLIYGSHEEPHQQLTVVEVAAMLRVSRATVYRLVHAGHLPGMRVGRSIRVSRTAVEKYVRDAALGGGHG